MVTDHWSGSLRFRDMVRVRVVKVVRVVRVVMVVRLVIVVRVITDQVGQGLYTMTCLEFLSDLKS